MEINNIPIKIIKDKKFKTIQIKIVCYNQFTKENATAYTLLTRMLTSSTYKYNTKEKMHQITGKLYGAGVGISTTSFYTTRVTTITLKLINPKYILTENTLLDDALDFLYHVLCRPHVFKYQYNKRYFETHAFNEEKRILENDIENTFNNKKSYAFKRAIQNMCPGEHYSISRLGTLEDLEKINEISLYDTYLDLLYNSKKYIFIYGDVEDDIVDKLKVLKKLKSQDVDLDFNMKYNIDVSKVKEVLETGNINQAALVMGYRTEINHYDSDYYAFRLFLIMLGGMATSTLHQVIREKHNLCYSIYTTNSLDHKLFFIGAGIDKENYSKTVDLIKEEVSKYQNGIVDEKLLNIVKLDMKNQFIDITDYPSEIINLEVRKDVMNLCGDVDKLIELYDNVVKEDIVRVANRIKLDTVYMLSN